MHIEPYTSTTRKYTPELLVILTSVSLSVCDRSSGVAVVLAVKNRLDQTAVSMGGCNLSVVINVKQCDFLILFVFTM